MTARQVAQSVRQRFRLANPTAHVWEREGSRLWGDCAAGPYTVCYDEDRDDWVVSWSDKGRDVISFRAPAKQIAILEAQKLAERWRRDKDRKIYFIGTECAIGLPVKIGMAYCPAKRLAELQTAWPYDLRILAQHIGDREEERRYHRKFYRCQLRGEWFRITPALKRLIEKHALTLSTGAIYG